MAELVTRQSVARIGTPAQKPEAPVLPTLAGQLPATPRRILVRRVIKATAEHFGTTPDDLVSARRTRPLTRRRQVAMYVARKMTGRSFFFIGCKIGDRHHNPAWRTRHQMPAGRRRCRDGGRRQRDQGAAAGPPSKEGLTMAEIVSGADRGL
jgi:hypothetical protein